MIGSNILNYRITDLIGEGGMGTVYAGIQETLGRKVAIKMLNPIFSNNEEIKSRFINEAITLSKLNHNSIVALYDFAKVDNNLFLIMEYIEGETLSFHINNKSVSFRKLIIIFLDIVKAFSYAHSKGIIHRDIKPSNILIQHDGTPKILDFGIAKLLETDKRLTKTGTRMGSILYMSPEQITGTHIDFRTDIYSLGVTFYECFTGYLPYDTMNDTEFNIQLKIVREPLPKILVSDKKTEDIINDIIQKSTQKNPNERFQNCNELYEALNQLYEITDDNNYYEITTGKDSLSYPVEQKSQYPESDIVTKISLKQGYRNKRKTIITIFSVLFLFLLLVVILFIIWKKDKEPEYFKNISMNSYPFKYYDPVIDSLACKYYVYHRVIINDTLKKIEYLKKGSLSDGSVFGNDVAVVEFEYKGDDIIMKYKDKYDNYIRNDNSIFSLKYTFNKENNNLIIENLDKFGEPVYDDYGVTKYKCSLDTHGNIKEKYFFDGNNKQIRNVSGIFSIKYEYDTTGNLIKQFYYDKDGNLKIDINYIAVYEYKYDSCRNMIEIRKYDSDNILKCDKENNAAIEKFKYDTLGNCIEIGYFDKNEEIKRNSDGVAIIRYIIDEEGNNEQISYYDVDEELIKNITEKAAIIKFNFDDNSNITEINYYDYDSILINNKNGVSTIRKIYSKIGECLEIRYYDKNDNLVKHKIKDFAVAKYVYNKNREIIQESYFDDKEKPIIYKPEGSKVIKYEYDRAGHIISKAFFDDNGSPVKDKNKNVEKILNIYNNKGQLIEAKMCDNLSMLKEDKSGVAVYKYFYDEDGNNIEIKYFGKNLMPKADKYGTYSIRFIYNNRRNMKKLEFTDKNYKRKNGYIELDYNSDDKPIKIKFMTSNGSVLFKIDYKYDKYGNLVSK